jgi:hypothetical protein
VVVIIRGPDAEQRREATWRPSLTVLTATREAGCSVETRGAGDQLLVESIGAWKNEGAGTASRNWLYWRNGRLGDRGAAVEQVRPGDEIVWRFSLWPPPDNEANTSDGTSSNP